eukprot:4716313-Prorocentrum_lima.AAC.1
MTSSLVGSEMCIRDSLIGADKGVIKAWAVRRRGTKEEQWDKEITHEVQGCLLYTSDAADDM